MAGIEYAKNNSFTLIVTLDCGVKANKQIDYANQNKIDVIVCDHHNEGDVRPDAYALLNPKQSDCTYPFKELSGCGVGFKLLQAYCISTGIALDNIYQYLDIVSVSTRREDRRNRRRIFGRKYHTESVLDALYFCKQRGVSWIYPVWDGNGFAGRDRYFSWSIS